MKAYESVFRQELVPRMPTIIRIDGKAFHSYTRGLPAFHESLMHVMDITAAKLCEEIQTVQFAYVQSDEISLLLHPYKKYSTQAWFDGNIQKMASVSAAIAAATFSLESRQLRGECRPAYFDSRVWVLPDSEVVNYFLWRQQDWTRNSVQMLARTMYSHAQCNNKNNSELQEMCFQGGQNWNNLPTHHRRGRAVVRVPYQVKDVMRTRWQLDYQIPIFSEDRNYIQQYLDVEPEVNECGPDSV